MKINLIHLLATSAVTIGLASCRTMAGYPWFFTMKFPDNVSLGELWLVEDSNCFTCGNGEKYLGPATGTKIVRLPGNGWFISLRMPRNVQHLVPYLADTSLKHVGDINLQGSNVTDEDLKYVAGINLRSINLRETKIIDSGLKYLKPNRKFIFVDLERCTSLNPNYLAHFRGWKNAAIRLVDYKWSGEKYSEEEKKLLAKANEIICDGQPESVCHTQIR